MNGDYMGIPALAATKVKVAGGDLRPTLATIGRLEDDRAIILVGDNHMQAGKDHIRICAAHAQQRALDKILLGVG